MKLLRHLLRKEFRQIFRNTIILRMIIALPIVQLLIIPLTADYEVSNINIAVVDQDLSSWSHRLTESVTKSGYFRLINFGSSYDEAFRKMEIDDVDLILVIPDGFEKKSIRQEGPSLFVAVNAINGMKAQVGNGYLSQIIMGFNQEILVENLPNISALGPTTIDIKPRFWFNPTLSYPFFMVPGILVILVTMVGGYMTALNIVKEKETGTIDQINVSPIPKGWFILGKLIPFWILGMVVFTIGIFGVGYLVYGIEPVGNIGLVYGYLAVYLVAILGFGLMISTYSDTQQQAMSLAFLFMMIFVLMSGLFTPVESMPTWARWIAYANPVTWFIDAIRLVIMKGSQFRDILPHFGVMGGFAVVFNSWAVWNYRKSS